MIQKLRSLETTIYSSMGLVLILFAGALFGRMDTSRFVVRWEMNDMLIWDWVIHKGPENPIILIWFLALVLCAALLLVNTALCTWKWFKDTMEHSVKGRRYVLMLIHVLFFALVCCHGVSFVWGEKSRVALRINDQATFGNGYSVTLEDITFVDNPAILLQGRHGRMKDNFSWEKNSARIVIRKGEQLVATGDIRHMHPRRFDGYQISLFKFTGDCPSQKKSKKHHHDHSHEQEPLPQVNMKDLCPGAVLLITRNPITPVFFLCFVGFIITMVAYMCMPKRTNGMKKALITREDNQQSVP